MRVVVDAGKCGAYGLCESVASDVFTLAEGSVVKVASGEIDESRLADVTEAVDMCPMQALHFEEA